MRGLSHGSLTYFIVRLSVCLSGYLCSTSDILQRSAIVHNESQGYGTVNCLVHNCYQNDSSSHSLKGSPSCMQKFCTAGAGGGGVVTSTTNVMSAVASVNISFTEKLVHVALIARGVCFYPVLVLRHVKNSKSLNS